MHLPACSLLILMSGLITLHDAHRHGYNYNYRQSPIYFRPQSSSSYEVPQYQSYYKVQQPQPRAITAIVELQAGTDKNVGGKLYLKQKRPGGPVLISGQVFGLKEGLHGFHVHMEGKVTDECKDAGPHFNPFMKSHGDPQSPNRHAGDLGNIMTFTSHFSTEIFIMDKLITLEPGHENSILGRSIVVHAKQDDLGQGGDAESLKTGNAGARLACGVITEVNLPY